MIASIHRCGWFGVTIVGFGVLVLLAAKPSQGQPAFRGFWADAFHPGFKSTSEIDEMVQLAVTGRYNAIVAEVLAYQDSGASGHGAYWNSSIVPKAADISGGIDPLAYLCDQAHAEGIQVHAWLVTYRVSTSWPPSGNSGIAPEWIMVARGDRGGGPATIGGAYYMDPGSPHVQDYLLSIVRELVTNYEVDGINWDYIRYTQTDAGYPADNSYYDSGLNRFQRIAGRSDVPSTSDPEWSDFRRRTIDELIRRCRAEIPSITSNPRQPVCLSADLFCSGNAPADFTQSTAYGYFQNWKHWMEMGWLDAGIPMNYKREHCSDQAIWYRNWIDAAIGWRYDRHMYCGQANYLNSMSNSVIQMQYALNAGADGTANYSYYATRSTEALCDGNDVWVHDISWYPYIADNLFTSSVPIPTLDWRDSSTASEGTLWGRVMNWDTGMPVDDATVQVGAFSPVQTDGGGYYVVSLIPSIPGGTSYAMSITKTGVNSGSHPAAIVFPGDVVRYDFSLGALAPRIAVAPELLESAMEQGESLDDDSFTVGALGTNWYGPVNYTITDDVVWLSCEPYHGSSNGELDTITVIYDTAGLPPGEHVATITVSDAAASNNPQEVTVIVTVSSPPITGDFDTDGDVDQDDFGHIQGCLSGESNPQNEEACQNAKLDGDGDVDQADVAIFLSCMGGANAPVPPGCVPN